MAKSGKQNIMSMLQKEIQQMEQEEESVRNRLQTLQKEIRDLKQVLVTLQGSVVHVSLASRIFDAVQSLNRFVSAAEIAEELAKSGDFLDLRKLKRDVNSDLNRMKKKEAVIMFEHNRIQVYGLQDWVDFNKLPLPAHAPR